MRIGLISIAALGASLMMPVGPATAATASANGSLYPTTTSYPVYFATTRYHRRANALRYRLTYTNDPCGGGLLSLRPYRTNSGAWMSGWKSWPVGQGGDSRSDLKIWGGAGKIAPGNFKLVGALGTNCGTAHTRAMRFEGKITF